MNYSFVIAGEAQNPLGLLCPPRHTAPPTTIRA